MAPTIVLVAHQAAAAFGLPVKALQDRQNSAETSYLGEVAPPHLLRLLDEGLLEEIPGDVFHNAICLLQSLVDGHSANLQ